MRRMLRKLRTALTGRGTMGVASPASAAPAGLTEILETLDDGLLVTDLSLTIVQWNAAMERLSGLPRASAIGRNADRLLPLLDAPNAPQAEDGAHRTRHHGCCVASISGPRGPHRDSRDSRRRTARHRSLTHDRAVERGHGASVRTAARLGDRA